MANNKQNITLTVIEQQFNVLRLSGTEEISQPYHFTIDIAVADAEVDIAAWLLTTASLNIGARQIKGFITRSSEQGIDDEFGKLKIRLILEPRLALTKLSQTVRVILEQTVPEIVRELLINIGYEAQQLKFHLKRNYATKPYRLQVPNETDFAFMQRLLAKEEIFYWFDIDTIHFSDSNDVSPYAQHTITYKALDGLDNITALVADQTVIVTTDLAAIQVGHSIGLDAERFNNAISGDYIIKQIEHTAVHYYGNKVLLQPRSVVFKPVMPDMPLFPSIFQAHIESNGNYAQLDENGAYYLRQRFDLSDKANTSASPPLTRIAPYGGETNDSEHQQVGWHFPLLHNAEVLVSALDDDPDQPIILGAVPNADKSSPVTVANKTQNILHTVGDNQLLMDDAINKEQIQLSTYGQQNFFELNATQNAQQINMISQQGAINWYAKQTIYMQSDAAITEQIGDERIQIAAQNHNTRTKNQDIHYQAYTDHKLVANNSVQMQAKANMEFNSGSYFNITADNHINLIINGDYMVSEIKQGHLLIQSNQDLTITGDAGGDIEFGNHSAGFKITQTGTVELYGEAVNGSAETGVSMQGEINCINTANQASAPLYIPNPVIPQSIVDLKSAAQQADARTKPSKLKFNDEYADQFSIYLQTLADLQWVMNTPTGDAQQLKFKYDTVELPAGHDEVTLILEG